MYLFTCVCAIHIHYIYVYIHIYIYTYLYIYIYIYIYSELSHLRSVIVMLMSSPVVTRCSVGLHPMSLMLILGRVLRMSSLYLATSWDTRRMLVFSILTTWISVTYCVGRSNHLNYISQFCKSRGKYMLNYTILWLNVILFD